MTHISRFEARHIDEAARLFSEKYARLRAANDLLPAQFADPAAIAPMLDGILREHPGAVAYRGERMAGYMTGRAGIPSFFGHAPGAYVPVWAHCIADDQEIGGLLPALYAEMSAEWVSLGYPNQAISYFVDHDSRSGALQEALFGLGFGLQVIDGIRPVTPMAGQATNGALPSAAAKTPASDAPQTEIASLNAEDLAAVRDLDTRLAEHLRSAPTFLHTNPVPRDKISHNFLRKGVKTYLAWQGDTAVAGIRGVLDSGPGCELFDVQGSLGVNFGYTDPSVRRNGVASRLLNALLQWGAERGMVRCVVDFESANLLARGFWLHHFQPVCHSVVRKVDDRMA